MPPKKYPPDFLTQKNTEDRNLDPKKYVGPPRRVNFEYPPWAKCLCKVTNLD